MSKKESDEGPILFTMPRNYTLAEYGHIVVFEKGKPQAIPPALHKHALAVGAQPSRQLAEEEMAVPNKEPVDPVEREKAAFAGFDALKARAKRTDFNGANKPNIHALTEVLGWEIDSRERDELWSKYLQQGKG